jgi:hypothetical protein
VNLTLPKNDELQVHCHEKEYTQGNLRQANE